MRKSADDFGDAGKINFVMVRAAAVRNKKKARGSTGNVTLRDGRKQTGQEGITNRLVDNTNWINE